jgi:heme exporter protein A
MGIGNKKGVVRIFNKVLSLTNAVCYRNNNAIVNGISFSLRAGELVVVKGKNGAGKTTLLKAIGGLLTAEGIDRIAEHTWGYIPSEPVFESSLKVRFWLQTFALIFGVCQSKVEYALDELGLLWLQEHTVAALSSGQAKRLQLAKLWLMDADIWLLDEPFNFLDDEGQLLLVNKLAAFLNQGGGVIVASHNDHMLAGIDRQTIWLGQS